MIPMQEAFDKVAYHLNHQKGRSISEESCAYMDEQGRRCAVGCLIPDGHIVFEEANGMYIGELIVAYEDLAELLGHRYSMNYMLLRDLQAIHDNRDNWDSNDKFQANDKLRDLASDFGLEYKEEQYLAQS